MCLEQCRFWLSCNKNVGNAVIVWWPIVAAPCGLFFTPLGSFSVKLCACVCVCGWGNPPSWQLYDWKKELLTALPRSREDLSCKLSNPSSLVQQKIREKMKIATHKKSFSKIQNKSIKKRQPPFKKKSKNANKNIKTSRN